MSIRYRSTNGLAPVVSLADALLAGQAPDRGLYMPEQIPPLPSLDALVGRPYPDVAAAVLAPYTDGEFEPQVMESLCADAYDFPVPVEPVLGRRHVLRLDRGPTASFKDFAARMMGRLLGRLVRQRGGRDLLILVATSGDTGSAVAQAFHGVEGIQVLVLFPVGEVSPRQRRQMTTLGGNVGTLAVDGKFDDCQAMVKQAFSDPALSHLRLSSANSINIGRLLPQSVYYVWAYLQVADVGAREPVVFSVPSGNFGDLCGGLLAFKGGLPVSRFVVATNANDEVPRFFESGLYEKLEPSRACVSNAMNVGHPSNLARLVDLYGGQMDEKGGVSRAPDMDAIRRDLWALSVSDADTRATIARAWRDHGTLLEPHGAVGWEGLCRFLDTGAVPAHTPAISLETAHPAKFPDEILAATGVDPDLPPALSKLEQLTESFDRMPVDYAALRQHLLTRF